jgi:hypothetical protein
VPQVEPHTAPHLTPSEDADQQVLLALLARTGLLDPGDWPELDRWTAVLRRATGAAVAALSVRVGELSRPSRFPNTSR